MQRLIYKITMFTYIQYTNHNMFPNSVSYGREQRPPHGTAKDWNPPTSISNTQQTSWNSPTSMTDLQYCSNLISHSMYLIMLNWCCGKEIYLLLLLLLLSPPLFSRNQTLERKTKKSRSTVPLIERMEFLALQVIFADSVD